MRELKAVRGREGAREYLVSWEGYSTDEDTWEPEVNLQTDTGVASYAGYTKLRNSLTLDERARHLGPARHWQGAPTAHGKGGTAPQATGLRCRHCPTWWPAQRARAAHQRHCPYRPRQRGAASTTAKAVRRRKRQLAVQAMPAVKCEDREIG